MVISEIDFPHKSSALLPSFNLALIAFAKFLLINWVENVRNVFSHRFIAFCGYVRQDYRGLVNFFRNPILQSPIVIETLG